MRRPAAERALVAAAVAAPLIAALLIHSWTGVSYVGTALLAWMVAKLVASRRGRRRRDTGTLPAGLRVTLVVPVHNEDPQLVTAAVRSMLEQTRPPDRIHVVDDGSTDGGLAAIAAERELRSHARGVEWEVTRLRANQGKRQALATGFRSDPAADVYVCVDSDTLLDPHAIAAGLRPLADPGVSAVAGFVHAVNWRRNLLTRVIDLRYVSAFLAERAAYSLFGAVLCCCGSLSFYRGAVVRANLADFTDQQFLGRPASFGDDRRLTNYALRAGRVVLAEDARAATAVPERLGHYARQQVRWNKSFVRESTWVLGTFPLRHPAFWLTLVEVVGWFLIGTLLLATVVVLGVAGELARLLPTLLLVPAIAYARNAAYLEDTHRGLSVRERAGVLALAPVYGVLHLGMLVPLRLWALCTLRDVSWGTRDRVEVRLDGRIAGAPSAGGALPAAGWYLDPIDPTRGRYFDGAAWTAHETEIPTGSTLATFAR